MKKAISILLVLVLLFSLAPLSVFAAGDEYETITGTVMFNAGHDDSKTDHPCPFTYSDEYFTQTGYNYRQDLATVTMAMCFAAGNVADPARYKEGPANLIDFFDQIGFKDFEANKDFTERPGRNTFGVGIANKVIYIDGEKYTVIGIGLRGCGYYAEWAGDLNVGLEGEHTGFAICRDTALAFLKDYLAKHTEITGKVKLWCTGYSRGAAGTNMLGGAIDDIIASGGSIGKNVELSADDMYFYCYEPPMGADVNKIGSSIYNNIHNIVNYNDLVVKVAPECMGFGRYGVDHVLPSAKLDDNYDALKADMLEVFSTFENAGTYRIDNFKYVTVTPKATISKIINLKNGITMTQGEFLDRFVQKLFTEVFTKRAEVYAAQDDISEIVLPLIGTYPDQWDTFVDILSKNAAKNIGELIYVIKNKSTEEVVNFVANLFLDAMREAGITEYNFEQVKKMVRPLTLTVIKIVTKCPDEFATLIFNIVGIMSAHYGELGMSWMMSIPDDYMNSKPDAVVNNMPFTDVGMGSWFYDNVKYCYDNGLMIGADASSFAPEGTVSRGQVVTVLYRLAGTPSVAGQTCPFTDADESWCNDAIVWGYNAGVVMGYDDNTFRPDECVTREQLAAFVYRYANDGAAASGKTLAFTDGSLVSDYAVPAMNWCIKKGVVIGMGDGTLYPQGGSTRAQFAAMISRLALAG